MFCWKKRDVEKGNKERRKFVQSWERKIMNLWLGAGHVQNHREIKVSNEELELELKLASNLI